MATSATDIISLNEAKRQVGISEDDTSDDANVTSAISGAVGVAQSFLEIPLLDVNETLRETDRQICFYSASQPIMVRARDIYPAPPNPNPDSLTDGIEAIRYWTTDQEIREEAGGTIDVATLGRRVESWPSTLIYPPDDGWPERLSQTGFEIDVRRGYEIKTGQEDIKSAILILTQMIYDAPDRIDQRSAPFTLLSRFKRHNG